MKIKKLLATKPQNVKKRNKMQGETLLQTTKGSKHLTVKKTLD